jgi:hypothetical protein
MARFLSLKTLIRESLQTLYRFPFTLTSAIFGTLVALNMTRLPYDAKESEELHACLLMVCGLGIILFFAITMFAGRRQFTRSRSFLVQGIAAAGLVLYFIYLRLYFVQVEFIRFALMSLALHLFASFAAYTGRNNLAGFWQFNKALFLRLFFAGIYSATIYIGIALAITAVDELFNVSINGKNYFRVWIVVVGIFNTWFFLAGVPKDLEALNHRDDYPKGLKIFTQYVLLPLVTLYLLILYAYLAKILVTQSLPKGWVSYLVLGFSVLGILALLLIWPIRNKEGNSWIRIFSRWFYGALYPLIIMLFIAILRRVSDYGITENRYFIMLLAAWLASIATYFLFSRATNIKLIPLTLCLLALFSSFGPWGAFSVSERSQFSRLEKILADNGVLVNGKIDAKHPEVHDTIAEQVTSIVSYFNEIHGFEKFKPWFGKEIDTLADVRERWNKVAAVMKLMNIRETYNYGYYRGEDGEGYRYFSYSPEYAPTSARLIAGYDYDMAFNAATYEYATYNKYTLNDDTLQFSISKDSLLLNVSYSGRLLGTLDMNKFIRDMNDSAHKQKKYNTQIPQRFMEKILEDSTLRVKLQFNSIYGYVANKNYKTTNAGGNCLIKLKTKVPD